MAIAAAAAAIGGAVFFIVKDWDKSKSVFQNIGAGLADFWKTLLNFARQIPLLGQLIPKDGAAAPKGRDQGGAHVGNLRLPGLSFPGDAKHSGHALGQGLAKGLQDSHPVMKSAVERAADNVIGWTKSRLGIHSPSTVFAAIGRDIVARLGAGDRRQRDTPRRLLWAGLSRPRGSDSPLRPLGAVRFRRTCQPGCPSRSRSTSRSISTVERSPTS